ncbi:MAG: CbiQ family ECF transporter T component [Actinomycetia bacterium]|nr:CbiQ family ECF transporter T component [Actinomycetes bacterium]
MIGLTPRTIGSLGVGWRLALMLIAEIALVAFARSLAGVGVAAVLVLAAYVIVRIPPARAWQSLRFILLLALIVGGLQAIVLPWQQAVVIGALLFLAVAIAALVTLTTSTTDLLDGLERGMRPLRRIGVDSERVALTLALTIRTIPVIAASGARLREAARARGVRITLIPYAVGLVVLTLQHAERVGEALTARGVDD